MNFVISLTLVLISTPAVKSAIADKTTVDQLANDVTTLLVTGDFLDELGREDEAFLYWQKAKELDPTNALAWNNLANVYGHRGEGKTAMRYYEKAIELDSTQPEFFQNFATTVFLFRHDAQEVYREDETKVFDRALRLYEKAIALAPIDLALLEDFATSFDGIRPYRFSDALASWQRVIHLAEAQGNLNSVDGARIHMARFETLAKHFDDARKLLDQIKIRPDQESSILIHKERILKRIEKEERINFQSVEKSRQD
jgi:tetratricopeptide (TPR) repeat protein